MKKIISILTVTIPVFILLFCTGSIKEKEDKKQVSSLNKNVAVLELFTSQGCSSCPAADRLLGSYSSKEGVIALSFHVDYWNHLGWKDPFSSAAFSQRQHTYANEFASSGVYTPQLIVNGQKEMVGSDKDKIAEAVKYFQNGPSSSKIIIDGIKTDNNKLSLTFSLQCAFKNSAINIALIQNKVTTPVKAGENGGVTLANDNVVRNFKTINQFNAKKNIADIDLVDGIDKKEFSVVVYLQDVTSKKIYAAIKSSL